MTERGKMKKTVREAEAERVAGILKRDADDAERERRRAIAVAQVASGEFANLDDTVVPPTAEQLEKGEFTSYTPRGEKGTVRSVRTVRRLHITQITYLLSRGVLDEDLYRACRWYRDRFDAAQLAPGAGVQSYGDSVRGDRIYGHLPHSQWAAEARSDYRWASSFIPSNVCKLFDMVVLEDVTIGTAAMLTRCNYRNGRASFLKGAHSLFGGISYRLATVQNSDDGDEQA